MAATGAGPTAAVALEDPCNEGWQPKQPTKAAARNSHINASLREDCAPAELVAAAKVSMA